MNSYQVDTKNICFLCLKKNTCSKKKTNYNSSTLHSFSELSRVVKFNHANVFNLPDTKLSVEMFEGDTEIKVNLCINCSPMLNHFNQLYKELELIKVKLNGCVRNVLDIMTAAEDDFHRLEEYRHQMMTRRSSLDRMNASIADNLRKETIQKCSARLNIITPSVKAIKIELFEVGVGGLENRKTDENKTVQNVETKTETKMEVDMEEIDENVEEQQTEDGEEGTFGAMLPCSHTFSTSAYGQAISRRSSKRKSSIALKKGYPDLLLRYKCHQCLVKHHLGDVFKECKDPNMLAVEFNKKVTSLVGKYVNKLPKEKKYVCMACLGRFTMKTSCKFHVITRHRKNIVAKLGERGRG